MMTAYRTRLAVAALFSVSCNTVEPAPTANLSVALIDADQWAGSLVRVVVRGDRPVEETRLWHTTGETVLPVASITGDTVSFRVPHVIAGEHSFRVTLGQDTTSFLVDVYGFVGGPTMLGFAFGYGFLPWQTGRLIRPDWNGGYVLEDAISGAVYRFPGITGQTSDPVEGYLPGTIVVSPGENGTGAYLYDTRTGTIVDSVPCRAERDEEVVALPGGTCLAINGIDALRAVVVRNATDTLFTTFIYSRFRISAAAQRVVIQDEQWYEFLEDIGGWELLDFSGNVVTVIPEYLSVPAAAFDALGQSLWALALIDTLPSGTQEWVFDERDPATGALRSRMQLPTGFEYRSFHRSVQLNLLLVFGVSDYPAPTIPTLFVMPLDGDEIIARIEIPDHRVGWMGIGAFVDGGATDRAHYVGVYSDYIYSSELARVEWRLLRHN